MARVAALLLLGAEALGEAAGSLDMCHFLKEKMSKPSEVKETATFVCGSPGLQTEQCEKVLVGVWPTVADRCPSWGLDKEMNLCAILHRTDFEDKVIDTCKVVKIQ